MDAPADAEAFGNWLRSLRLAAGLTQQELAQAASSTQRTLQRWEDGENDKGVEVLRLLTALGVKVDPPPPREVKAISSLAREIRETLEIAEKILRQEREEAAVSAASFEQSLREVSNLATEGLARVEAEIARVGERLDGAEPRVRPEEAR